MDLTSRAGRGWASGAALFAVLVAGAFGATVSAGAASLAYVDGGEVWVSTLDGQKKVRLSGGEGDWRQVTAADGGKMLGIRLESGKISQISRTQLWDKAGNVINQGPLPYESLAWSSYAAPIGLDLSSDGVFLAYGYSGYTGIVPNAFFYSGHNVVNADTQSLNQPIGQTGYKWPTMYGRRVVAAQGSLAVIQKPDTGPFGNEFNALVETSGTGLDLARSDVAANGKLLAFDLLAEDSADDRIGVVSISGVEPPVTVGAAVDCYLPSVGDASDATLSQDGTRIAWADDQGVKVAGVPTTLADPCALSSPPVLISATGRSPSIGGADFNTVAPPKVLEVKLPPSLKTSGLATPGGATVTLTVPARGRIKVTGTVPVRKLGLKGGGRVIVITGSAVAGRAGPVKVKLHMVSKYRKYRSRLKGATVRLKFSQGSLSITRNVKLR